MEIQYYFNNIESSNALKEYAKKIVDKMSVYFNRIISVMVRFKLERSEHIVEITINGDKGVFVAEGRSENMYASLDLVEKKLEKQIQKHRDKFTSHH